MVTQELLNIVQQYTERAITLEELEDWLVPRLPLFFRLPYTAATELVTEIEAALADMSDHRQTEDEFRNLLRNLIKQVEIVWVNYPSQSGTTYAESSNQASPVLLSYITSGLETARRVVAANNT